ncbi:MAG TPA: endo-1,4-beta-xylanase [Ktedonobacteraceae bacterium]|jgi:endo-1,4-beta-xylanase|nr:endo-1,4-beta-xylanase [Ktedonobacteraceae bacterium]
MVKLSVGKGLDWMYFLILTLLMSCIVSCSTANSVAVSPLPTHTVTHATLRSLALKRHFYIGTTVNMDALQDEAQYSRTLATEFNMVTPEVVMKFDATEPQSDVFNFAEGDRLLSYAQAHGMQVRGHNLVWYTALPDWLTKGKFSRDQLIAILREHILTEVSHYRGQVNIWDVVNEALNDDGTLRNSIWLQGIGSDYLAMAFRWAHQANPQARLFYNDYGGEGLGPKSDAIYALVKNLLQQGVPINGVGLQMHVSIDSYPRPQDVLANMRRLEALGLEVQITEMDVKIQGDTRPMQEKLKIQAGVYQDMLSVCLVEKRCTAFVMWGFTDLHSWIPAFTHHADAPLIFDVDYHPKPAFYALINVLARQ